MRLECSKDLVDECRAWLESETARNVNALFYGSIAFWVVISIIALIGAVFVFVGLWFLFDWLKEVIGDIIYIRKLEKSRKNNSGQERE